MSATVKSMFTDWMTADAQKTFYTDPHVSICGTARPSGHARTVPGGTRITGRWSYASGCLDAPWAMLGAAVPADETTGHPRYVLLPTDELTIERTWDGVAGLQGTGSHTLDMTESPAPRSGALSDDEIDRLLQGIAEGFRSQLRAPVLHTPDEVGLDFEDVTFPSSDGVPPG